MRRRTLPWFPSKPATGQEKRPREQYCRACCSRQSTGCRRVRRLVLTSSRNNRPEVPGELGSTYNVPSSTVIAFVPRPDLVFGSPVRTNRVVICVGPVGTGGIDIVCELTGEYTIAAARDLALAPVKITDIVDNQAVIDRYIKAQTPAPFRLLSNCT